MIFWMQTIFQNLTCPKLFNAKSNGSYFFQSKTWRFVKISIGIWRVLNFFFKIWRVRKIEFQIWQVLKYLFSEIWFLSCFSSSDWMKIYSVNVNNNLFWGTNLNNNVCCRFSRQMYNWKLPEANSSLNGCKTFKRKSDVLYFLKMKKWRVQYDFESILFSIPNLTRCKSFKSKSDAYWNF